MSPSENRPTAKTAAPGPKQLPSSAPKAAPRAVPTNHRRQAIAKDASSDDCMTIIVEMTASSNSPEA